MNGVICYIGIGSNLGNALENCRNAVENLGQCKGIEVTRFSSFYETEAVGIVNQKNFVNAVAEIRTVLSARKLLQELQNVEKKMGRRREVKGGPRIIDLDILFYGHDLIRETDLEVPHPEMHKRRFVLEPLEELTSYMIHPVFCISIRGLKERLTDDKMVKLIRN
ncbi:MAG: 2-amino-4-hydroxy-6-hydroxymethyldihydropteridine pyrophosphokinase [Smithella sp. SDB]|nr:MAG: 2-amino-4-hydroxy-6-hydroxymethyldihydropteridine pyrophosphokinase [Smithella sp. SDB]